MPAGRFLLTEGMRMQGVALNIGIATAVFFVVTLVWQGNLVSTAFSAVVFAMTYGAIQAGLVIFKGEDS